MKPSNRKAFGGVLLSGVSMNEWTGRYPATAVTVDVELEREFEARLHESSTLAFRVAYGVLRNRQDAEDLAREAFAKA